VYAQASYSHDAPLSKSARYVPPSDVHSAPSFSAVVLAKEDREPVARRIEVVRRVVTRVCAEPAQRRRVEEGETRIEVGARRCGSR
jgi:hypothetical protein